MKNNDGARIGIPKPDAVDTNGNPVDVLATLKFKRDLAENILPGIIQIATDIHNGAFLQGEGDEEDTVLLRDNLKNLKEVAKAFGVPPHDEDLLGVNNE